MELLDMIVDFCAVACLAVLLANFILFSLIGRTCWSEPNDAVRWGETLMFLFLTFYFSKSIWSKWRARFGAL